jgi:hypothetical protein
MPVFDLEVHVASGKLRAGTYGRGLWESPLFVPDNTPPVVVCPANVVVNNTPGQCQAPATYMATTTDDCTDNPAISYSIPSGSVFPVGTTPVTVVATDVSGNSASCNFNVTVVDNEPPNAICQDIAVMPDDNGDYHIHANDVDNGSTDNCAIGSISVFPDFIPCFHESYIQSLTLTVTDIHGNSATCDAEVTLLDDDDCDGVGNKCDLCPGGNDQVDNNSDGLPDCAFFPGLQYLIDEWKCGLLSQKVLMCHFFGNGNYNTLCVNPNAVQPHLDHGDYVGPCDNANCDGYAPLFAFRSDGFDFTLFPNPASDEIFVGLEAFAGMPVTLRIFNTLGQLVQEIRIPEVQSDIEVLDVRAFGPGMYQMELSSGEVRIGRKFVLN